MGTVGRVIVELLCRGDVVSIVAVGDAVFGCCVEGRYVEGHSVRLWCWGLL